VRSSYTFKDYSTAFTGLRVVAFLIIVLPLDAGPALLLLAPVLLPITRSKGIDDMHFSMVMIVSVTLGLMSPPADLPVFWPWCISRSCRMDCRICLGASDDTYSLCRVVMLISVTTAKRPMNRNATTTLGGIAYVVLAGACFATLDTTTQYVALSVPVLMALWARYLIQALLSTAFLLPLHGRALFRTAQPRLQLLRGLLLISITALVFFSLRFMPVGELTAIVMATPMVVTVLLVLVFKQ